MRWWRRFKQRGAATAAAVVVGLAATGGAAAVVASPDLGPPSLSTTQVTRVATGSLTSADQATAPAATRDAAAPRYAAMHAGDWGWAVLLVVGFYGGLALLGYVAAQAFRTQRMRRWALAVVGASGLAGVLWLLSRLLLAWRAHGLVASIASALSWAQLLLTVVSVLVVLAGLASLALPPRIRSVLAAVDVPRSAESPAPPVSLAGGPRRRLGLAFSGGGVRAASMTLGALQVLETQEDLGWPSAARVTAVSGGSYMAGGWSVARAYEPTEPQAPGLPPPWAMRGDQPSPEEQHLMANLGYLLTTTPRGVREADEGTEEAAARQRRAARLPAVFATVLTGMILNGAVLLAMVWAITQPWGWLYRGYFGHVCGWGDGRVGYDTGHTCLATATAWAPSLFWLGTGAAFVLLWVVVAKVWEFNSPDGPPGWVVVLKYVGYAGLGLGAALAVLLGVLPLVLTALWKPGFVTTNLVAAVGALGSAGAVVRTLRKPLARFAPLIGGAVFAALLTFVSCRFILFALERGVGWWSWLPVVAALLLVQAGLSPEWWSLAGFYRGKLRLGFATYRPGDGRVAVAYANGSSTGHGADARLPEPSLSTLATRDTDPVRGTPLRVCATATVSGRGIRTHHGIPAMSITFDPDHVSVHAPTGEPGVYRRFAVPTAILEDVQPALSARITTMLTVGLSGAAVSPAMGRFRVGPVSMLLTFANVRLGMWVPNPRYADAFADLVARGKRLPRPRLGYLLKEFFGLHDPSDLYLYVTDGGHWENTGLVELLRTDDCREVVCIDADAGPGNLASSISKAIDLAWLECRCRVVMDLDALRSEPQVTPGRDYSPRSVNLGLVERTVFDDTTVGILWYAKPALTREMPLQLLSYREVDPSFPRVSTLNQFFHLAQFAAYRDLGRYNAERLLDARRALQEATGDAATVAALRAAAGFDTAHWSVPELVRLIDDLTAREAPEVREARAELIYQQVRATLCLGQEPGAGVAGAAAPAE